MTKKKWAVISPEDFFWLKKGPKVAIFGRKNKVKLTIFRALVLVCHLYRAELENILLLSLTYSQIWLSPHSDSPTLEN
jgi:hypothetical protein